MVFRHYAPLRLHDVDVARAARLLALGVSAVRVMEAVEIGEGSVYRIASRSHPNLRRARRQRRCCGCGGQLIKPKEPCRVCRDRTELGVA